MIQNKFFNAHRDDNWKKEWKDMPEFVQDKQAPFREVIIRFKTEDDFKEFAKLINQKLTSKTKSIWYPKLPLGLGTSINTRYFVEEENKDE